MLLRLVLRACDERMYHDFVYVKMKGKDMDGYSR